MRKLSQMSSSDFQEKMRPEVIGLGTPTNLETIGSTFSFVNTRKRQIYICPIRKIRLDMIG